MTQTELEAAIFMEQLRMRYRLDQYTLDELKRISYALNSVEREVTAKLSTMPTNISQTRQIEFLDEIKMMTKATKQTMANNIATTAADVSVFAAEEHSKILSFGGYAKNIQRIALRPNVMESFWQTTPVGGRLLNDWINRTFDSNIIEKIQHEVATGLFQGETTKQLASRLSAGFNMTKVQAETLAHTYVSTANMDALQRTFDANKDVLQSVRWRATGDNKTCLICASLDSKKFPVNNHPPIPKHCRCRCTLQPIISKEAIGLIDKDAELFVHHEGISPKDFKINGRKLIEKGGQRGPTVSQWIQQQRPEVQIEMLGPKRYDLLQAGMIQWDDLVDLQTYRVRKIDELIADKAQALGLTQSALLARARTVAEVTSKADQKHLTKSEAEIQLDYELWRYEQLNQRNGSRKDKRKQLDIVNRLEKILGKKPTRLNH